MYVRGLLLDGARKSVEPMASRLGESDQDLHHFVSHSPWSADVLLEALARATATTAPAYWIIDETSFPKAGSHSAGVQRQYCGALGKKANCQLAVSLHRADEAAGKSQPLAWRLFLPESWTEDPARCQRAGIPPGRAHHSKQDLALGLLDQALGWKSPAGVVLADEAYGGFEWRLALRERKLFYCVRVPWTTTAWQEQPRFGPPAPVRRGFRAKRGPLLSPEPKNLLTIARALPAAAWKTVTVAAGHQGSAMLALCQSAFVGCPWLETGAAARASRRDRAHRVACRRTCSHALLAGAPAQEKDGSGQARRHRQGALAGRARLP